jgi:hypothetical protein
LSKPRVEIGNPLEPDRNGKTIATQKIEISLDLKTLTMTVQPVGRSKPNILVFDRE